MKYYTCRNAFAPYFKRKMGRKTPGGTRTHNFQIRSLARYPIASQGHIKKIPDKGIEPLTTRLKAVRSAN